MAYTKQTWENAPSTNSPLSADRLNHMEDGIYNSYYQAKNTYSSTATDVYGCNYINKALGTILWTNSSPSSDFASQSITLSSDDYDVLEFYFLQSTTANSMLPLVKIFKNYDGLAIYSSSTVQDVGTRAITRNSDTSYTIGDYYKISGGTGGNNRLIPIYVIGYKTGMFN